MAARRPLAPDVAFGRAPVPRGPVLPPKNRPGRGVRFRATSRGASMASVSGRGGLHADDGTEYHGAEGIARWQANKDKVRAHNERALAQLKPHELAKLETWLLTRTSHTPPHRPPSRPSAGRASPPRRTLVRGSLSAGSARRSSERSGDSGEDGPSDEPPSRRLCALCGKDIPAGRSPKATHCSDRHADRDRQRRKRQRDRARSKLPPTPTTADFRRMLQLSDEERDWLRAIGVCRCNGRHLEFDPGECFRCGHRLPREEVAA